MMAPTPIVTRNAMIRAGTARRNAGSAVSNRRYAGLAIDWASPLMESGRADACAASARAIAGLRSDGPRQPGWMCRISPNRGHWNRKPVICRERRITGPGGWKDFAVRAHTRFAGNPDQVVVFIGDSAETSKSRKGCFWFVQAFRGCVAGKGPEAADSVP